MVVEITPDKYMDKLVDYCMVKIYAMASVTETRQAWSEEDDFVISKPKLDVQVGTCFILQDSSQNDTVNIIHGLKIRIGGMNVRKTLGSCYFFCRLCGKEL